MEGKGNLFYIILLLMVAFLTLALALLAGYIFFGGGPSQPAENTQTQVVEKKYKPDELTHVLLNEGKDIVFNLKSDTKNPDAVPTITVNVKVEYLLKVDGIEDTTKFIEEHVTEINSVIGSYFMQMTRTEALPPDDGIIQSQSSISEQTAVENNENSPEEEMSSEAKLAYIKIKAAKEIKDAINDVLREDAPDVDAADEIVTKLAFGKWFVV